MYWFVRNSLSNDLGNCTGYGTLPYVEQASALKPCVEQGTYWKEDDINIALIFMNIAVATINIIIQFVWCPYYCHYFILFLLKVWGKLFSNHHKIVYNNRHQFPTVQCPQVLWTVIYSFYRWVRLSLQCLLKAKHSSATNSLHIISTRTLVGRINKMPPLLNQHYSH